VLRAVAMLRNVVLHPELLPVTRLQRVQLDVRLCGRLGWHELLVEEQESGQLHRAGGLLRLQLALLGRW
jgi:hypothetical protein